MGMAAWASNIYNISFLPPRPREQLGVFFFFFFFFIFLFCLLFFKAKLIMESSLYICSSSLAPKPPITTASDMCSESEWEKYKEEMSRLPKENGWDSTAHLYLYKGFWFYPNFLEGSMYARDHFKAHPADIFICSFMKSGCTWLKSLSFSIATRGEVDESTTPLRTTLPHNCVRFLDHGDFDSTPPGPATQLFSSHLPYQLLPESIIRSGCKIVYICRDPKDTLVSMWFFAGKVVDETRKESLEGSFVPIEEAFELFCEGVTSHGPYWDHVLGYWKASLEQPDKVLFLKYEDLMEETAEWVRRLAEFFGCPFSDDEEREGMVERIVNFCSFDNLSNLEVNKSGKHEKQNRSIQNSAYFRKGKVGDWRNYLTAEMADRLDKIVDGKLSGSGLTFRSSPLHN